MPKLLVLLSMLAYLDGSRVTAKPLERVAQSQEKSGQHPSAARLTFRETSRSASTAGERVHYALQADGLPQGKSYSVTGKWMNGKTGVIKGLHIEGSGRVLTENGGELDLALGKMFPGEFIEFTLAADDGTAKVSIEITPFPIEAVGNGGCRLSVRPMSIRGDIFHIAGAGFQPDQKINAVATLDGQVTHERYKSKGDGSLKIVVFPPVPSIKSGGEASLTASDTSCSVTVRYNWGNAMTQAASKRLATPSAPLPAQGAGPTPESGEDKAAEVEAAYRRSNYTTLLEVLRSASRDSAFKDRYRKAAEQGSAMAQGILGVMYEEGIGVSRDSAAAIGWFRKATDKDDPTAQKYLGDMYRRGAGVPMDYREAMKWYLKASEQGDGTAQAMLGVVYQKGLGVLPDLIQAYMWFTLAIAHLEGTERDWATRVRDRLSTGMSKAGIEKAEQLAREWKPTSAPVGGSQTTVAVDAKAADSTNAAQERTATAPAGDSGDLAWRAVDLDDYLWTLDVMFARGPRGTLHLGEEEITQANWKAVVERLQRERRALAAEMDRVGFSNISGDYELRLAPSDECKVSRAQLSDLSKPVSVVQNKGKVEFKGKGLAGCGVVVGTVVVLKTKGCEGTTPFRLVGKVTDPGIEMMVWDKTSGTHCFIGTLTRRSAQR